ncbi:MAG: hypothetical protein JNM20_09850 [Rhizobiales bacterium]|nr:hypothetical protein [Hyphomicrobiales bacterium]
MKNLTKISALVLVLGLGGAFTLPAFDTAEAQTQTQVKKKKKPAQQTVKKNYQATPPGQPNQAGMTDDCAYWYNVYGRMPVGCDKYGRSFRLWDN